MTARNHHKIPLNFSNAHSINLRIWRSWFTPGQYRRKYSDTKWSYKSTEYWSRGSRSRDFKWAKSKLRIELGCRSSILIFTRNGPMWRNGSVLHLQFWFVCKRKSRTLFLTLPSGLIQECSRFINKSGFIMIWSILAHWSLNQSNCL